MTIQKKIKNAKTNNWLSDALTEEERSASELIAAIAVSVQQERRAQGLSQKDFAEKLGVSQSMVSQWESGEENFTVTTLVRISSALGLSICNPLSA